MMSQNEFKAYRSLDKFLKANTEAARLKYARSLKEYYIRDKATDKAQPAAKEWSPIQIVVDLKKLDHLKTLLCLDKFKNKIAKDNFALFQAIENKDTEMVKFLLQDSEIRQRADQEDNWPLRRANKLNAFKIIPLLLAAPKVFAYAVQNEEEYDSDIHIYITKECVDLRILQSSCEIANVPFDIEDGDEAALLFDIAKYLIRSERPASLDNLGFILAIPAVKNLAISKVNAEQKNVLIQFALAERNNAATNLLLDIFPEQKALVNEEEIRGNIKQIIRNQESSMEIDRQYNERTSDALNYYRPLLSQEGGIQQVLENLRRTLLIRYSDNPATIVMEDKKILYLPADWEAFMQLKLSPTLHQQALKAYYQNKDHSAWRFLSKPNPWIDPEAQFKVFMKEGYCSEFESSKELIAISWLAASDSTKMMAPREGLTVEGRIGSFIAEIANMGRAHNWTSIDMSLEEQDNLKKDNPTCIPGMQGRLKQSVIDHPLFTSLTMEMVKQELRDFVRNHFKTLIIKTNCQYALKKDYEDYIVNLKISPLFQEFDINKDKQIEFIESLKQTYGNQFTNNTCFEKYIHARFQLQKNMQLQKKDSIADAHLINFAGEVN